MWRQAWWLRPNVWVKRTSSPAKRITTSALPTPSESTPLCWRRCNAMLLATPDVHAVVVYRDWLAAVTAMNKAAEIRRKIDPDSSGLAETIASIAGIYDNCERCVWPMWSSLVLMGPCCMLMPLLMPQSRGCATAVLPRHRHSG